MSPLVVQLLLSLGGSLAPLFIKNPALSGTVTKGVIASQGLVTALLNKQDIKVPAFFAALQASFGILQAEGEISAEESQAITDAFGKALAADALAQQVVDPSTLATPIQLVP